MNLYLFKLAIAGSLVLQLLLHPVKIVEGRAPCCLVDPQPTNYYKEIYTTIDRHDYNLVFPHFLFSNGSNPFYGVSEECPYPNLANYTFPSTNNFQYDYSCKINNVTAMNEMFHRPIVLIPNISCPGCNCTIEVPPPGQRIQSVSLRVNTKTDRAGETIYQFYFTDCSVSTVLTTQPYTAGSVFGQYLTLVSNIGRMRIKPSTVLLTSQVLLSAFLVLM